MCLCINLPQSEPYSRRGVGALDSVPGGNETARFVASPIRGVNAPAQDVRRRNHQLDHVSSTTLAQLFSRQIFFFEMIRAR